MARDPRVMLTRWVVDLEQRLARVTLADVQREARRRRTKNLPVERVADLVEASVAEYLLLRDLRTFFDRKRVVFEDRYVYRVNWRHPLVREHLIEDD